MCTFVIHIWSCNSCPQQDTSHEEWEFCSNKGNCIPEPELTNYWSFDWTCQSCVDEEESKEIDRGSGTQSGSLGGGAVAKME